MKGGVGMTNFSQLKISSLSGIGEVKSRAYARLGIQTLEDLLHHYPRAYENRGDVRLLADCDGAAKCSVILTVYLITSHNVFYVVS